MLLKWCKENSQKSRKQVIGYKLNWWQHIYVSLCVCVYICTHTHIYFYFHIRFLLQSSWVISVTKATVSNLKSM